MSEPSAPGPFAGDLSRPLVLSQTRRPASVRRLLVREASRDGWIVVAVNMNAALFLGFAPLTAGYGAEAALFFLIIHAVASMIAAAALIGLAFLREQRKGRPSSRAVRREAALLVVVEALIMAGWGGSAMLFLAPDGFQENILVVLMITTIGAITAPLSGRLPEALVLGRALLFAPPVAYLFWLGAENSGLLAALAVFGAATTLALGFAVHVQHLAQAEQAVELGETRDALSEALAETEAAKAASEQEAEMRERFMHSVTHDLRQPIGALRYHLAAVEQGGSAASLSAAQACVTSATGVIDSVAQLAFVVDGTPRAEISAVPLDPLFQQLAAEVAGLAREAGLSLRAARTGLSVAADPALLERATRNLVHNALQYTERGGVLIGARRRPGGRVAVAVYDTGPGVAEGEREAVFDAFHQTPGAAGRGLGNIGLGLRIVRDFAAAMGGEAVLRSRVGRGSCFALELPLTTGGAIDLDGLAVLVIDDDPSTGAAIAEALTALGADVEVLADTDRMRRLQAADFGGYEALVLDCMLAPDLTAREILAAAGPNRPPTVLATASQGADWPRLAAEAGVELLAKPAPGQALAAALIRAGA